MYNLIRCYIPKENAKSEKFRSFCLYSQDFLLRLVILLVVDGDGSAKDG